MKVELIENQNGLMIVPETELEEKLLKELYPLTLSFKAFLKTGMTASDVLGLKISRDTINQEENDETPSSEEE